MKSSDRFVLWVWGAMALTQMIIGLFVHLSFAGFIVDESVVVFVVLGTVAYKLSEQKKSGS